MELWLATYDDGDYYCEGHHLIGIFTTEELAKEAIDTYKDSISHQFYANSYSYQTENWQLNKIEL